MIGAGMVFVMLLVAVTCLIGFGAGRNRFGTNRMRLGMHNMAYLMDDSRAIPTNRDARRHPDKPIK
jgi:hypothetical protein